MYEPEELETLHLYISIPRKLMEMLNISTNVEVVGDIVAQRAQGAARAFVRNRAEKEKRKNQ